MRNTTVTAGGDHSEQWRNSFQTFLADMGKDRNASVSPQVTHQSDRRNHVFSGCDAKPLYVCCGDKFQAALEMDRVTTCSENLSPALGWKSDRYKTDYLLRVL